MPHGKTAYVCLPCRASYKQWYDKGRPRVCPRCAGDLIHAGSAFAPPRRRDAAAWRALSILLNAGVGFHKTCRGGPGCRPRTMREIRQRIRHAERAGTPLARVLGC
ncbi:deoxyxylulose-5-phosphate synthase [Streptomyces sp. NPDC087850]|uniref:deoxyxylulose-5-phosphate synthase n=1 Tax=Streptomyces sp. NPDC087850 TaxID=3365809 RepID=UPI00382AA365